MSRAQMLERFVAASPVSVIARVLMERVFAPDAMEALFARHAVRQRCGETLFSTLVDLMGLVVIGQKPSLNAAYQARLDDMTVRIASIYAKLQKLEPGVSEGLVQETAVSLGGILDRLGVARESLVPGYRVLVLDGNHLAGTQHRLKELRTTGAAALPGLVLALFDPATRLLTDVVCCEDGHTQERSLLPQLAERLSPGTLLIADRGFCTRKFTDDLQQRGVSFIIREHATNLPVDALEKPKYRGRVAGGTLYEQRVRVRETTGNGRILRRIVIRLAQKTRFGEQEIHLLSDLPFNVKARTIAAAYRGRWTIETCFGHLATTVHGELNTLGYPKAALFGFCLAVVMYNVLATILGVLGAQFGLALVDERVSLYYLADEISSVYAGMMIAVPAEFWTHHCADWTLGDLARELRAWARAVNLQRFRKHPRGPKKPPPPREPGQRGGHVSTARLLAQRQPNR